MFGPDNNQDVDFDANPSVLAVFRLTLELPGLGAGYSSHGVTSEIGPVDFDFDSICGTNTGSFGLPSMSEDEGGDKDAEMSDARESVEDVGEAAILELRGL